MGKLIPTQAQIKEFWEWCDMQKCFYYDMNGGGHRGFPPIDLNNLFKYAINQVPHNNWKFVLHTWIDNSTGNCEKDTLALFWAIWEVIHD